MQTISRRRLIGIAAAMAAVVGCAQATPTAAPKPTEAAKPTAAPAAPPPPTLAPVATKPAAPPATKPAAAATGQTLRMAFVPSADSGKVLATGQPLGEELGKITGLKFEVSVPTSYAAVIEASDTKRKVPVTATQTTTAGAVAHGMRAR